MREVRRVLKHTLWASLILLPVLPACNKKEQAVPAGPPPLPGLAGGARGSAVHGEANAPAAMPADHPPILRGKSEMQADAPAPAASAEGNIRGSIRLADKLKDKAQPGATIFLVARSAPEGGGPPMGPPLAVQRYTVGAWPMPFELTQDNVMLSGTKLQGKVVLTARVDQDGDAMTKQVGDIEGVSAPVTVPAQGVELVLDQVRTQAAGGPSPTGMGGGGGGMPPGHPSMPPGHPPMPPT